MKITFVHLGREHLGIEYLSSLLKNRGHETALAYDPGLFGPEDNVFYIPVLEKFFNQRQKVIRDILDSSPDLVAFTIYSGTYAWACSIAESIRTILDVPFIFGGIHATLVPEIVINNHFVDYVVEGEGFEAFPALVEALAAKDSVHNIANLWYKENGRVLKNSVRPPFAKLDDLPLPDKALFEKDVNFKDDYVILSSLGCVFSCSYCCESYLNKLYKNKYFRRRSVTSVMRELTVMQERYSFREVMFNDALFFTDKKWLRQLMEQYRKNIGVPFRCFGKVNYLDEDICRLLKKSGCYCIEFGMQTANQQLKRSVLNRKETNHQALAAFKKCDAYRLRYDIDHMFGLPGETEQDHIDGVWFYSRLKCLNRIKCHNLTYFPQTEITDIACQKKILNESDIEKINKGRIANFFHNDHIKDKKLKQSKDIFSKYYKLLPVIPAFLNRWFMAGRAYRLFRFLPFFLIVIGQLLVAAKGRDYRYIIYLKYYPLRIRRVFGNKWFPRAKKDEFR